MRRIRKQYHVAYAIKLSVCRARQASSSELYKKPIKKQSKYGTRLPGPTVGHSIKHALVFSTLF